MVGVKFTLTKVTKMTEEERVREIIAEEIEKKLKFEFENTGYQKIGLKIKVEYDGVQIEYDKI